ncbi:hypothetical protein SAMCFNEI73_pA0011 (plasmid) [Sinorhizobium americanum]|uniref:Uncharacterized protein n=1 Tax=Sinorhizobium americanum TaxID=194963 RepID=A0A1L3LSB8_9HYPH|nr:hypothetical protein SAMCFNEI73_pA0011 [Sinorhizobium americanum]
MQIREEKTYEPEIFHWRENVDLLFFFHTVIPQVDASKH